MQKIIYNAVIYLRLSKEDGDKEESYSISNQRDLAKDFLNRHPDIRLIDEMIDDGYSGSDFNRPAFKKMLDKILKGEVNCVIVKDLSRFARDYIGSGYYLEKLFPSMGVRFISINDNIDYEVDDSANTRLIMAFKNVLNDSYIHDISVKIRSQLEIKRKKGEYIGSFAVYGYRKSDSDKHKLVIDESAAEIVRLIFNYRMRGISAYAIADRLNLLGIPSPAEYKKQCGSNYSANLQRGYKAKWAAPAVIRILTNEVYTGTLIQGKSATVNYKVKKKIVRDRSEWSIVKNAHEPIISREQFEAVQALIKRDTRTSPDKNEPYLFSGFLFCGDCECSLVRRTAAYNGKKYAYYMCSTNKLGLGCASHRISEKTLYASVLNAVNLHLHGLSEPSLISVKSVKSERLTRIEKLTENKYSEISDLKNTLETVRAKQSDVMYKEICGDIQRKISTLEKEAERLRLSRSEADAEYGDSIRWLEDISQCRGIEKLNRIILVTLIDKIYVYEDKRIDIKFRHEDNFSLSADRGTASQEAV